jgi:hypothetical protein
MQNYIDDKNRMLKEQKGCYRGSKGRNDQLQIFKAILLECKSRGKALCMAWTDYQSFRQCAIQMDIQILRINWDQ